MNDQDPKLTSLATIRLITFILLFVVAFLSSYAERTAPPSAGGISNGKF